MSRSPVFTIGNFRIGRLTAILIGLSILVALVTSLGQDRLACLPFYITVFGGRPGGPWFPEIMHGEVWRLVTPIFLHLGIMHIAFNMMCLKDLGTAIEQVLSARYLLALVLVIGALSNLAQFAFAGPNFGGMSGVIYGLLGFIWMKAKFDPAPRFRMPQEILLWMLGWFVICVLGIMPRVANYAHGAGLLAGIIWGYISARRTPRKKIYADVEIIAPPRR